ncbi:hypothetical protein ACHQM5_010471 [Ranunculus cassubicifolius]
MKNLYPKNKGKVYPSPSSPSSSSSPKLNPDSALNNVLKFLPATILTLAAILSGEEREVLAYLITRSLGVTTNPPPLIEEKKKCKKPQNAHKVPSFDCGCFECYTGYWFRWDSSPNRELIHQVIEAFEEHLSNGEKSKKGVNNRGRKSREKVFDKTPKKNLEKDLEKVLVFELQPEIEVVPIVEMVVADEKEQALESEMVSANVVEVEEMMNVQGNNNNSSSNHKGLARKVLPDVMGLFNSRIWSLWSTNI